MPHLDPDVLALLALGEDVASPEEETHVETCAQCRAELRNLRRTATVGRTALGAGELLQPPTRLWNRIAEELDLSSVSRSTAAEPGFDAPAAVRGETTRADEVAAKPRRQRPRSRLVLALAAVALVLLVVGGGVTVWQLLRPARTEVL